MASFLDPENDRLAKRKDFIRSCLWALTIAIPLCLFGAAFSRGADPRNPGLLDAQLIWTVKADSAFDAMTKYYEYMGWGHHKSAFREIDKQLHAEGDDILPSV